MSYVQAITPTPHISCRPGWCLEYVRRAYGLPAVYPTAIAAWNASSTQHGDWNFPAGVWVPLWFTVKGVPAGHVVLRAPDGRIYSTTHPTRLTPTVHPDLADLERTYARAGLTLTYQGWTEDVAGTRVISATTITPQGTTQPAEEDDMFTDQDRQDLARTKELLLSFQAAITDPVTGYVGHAALAVLRGGAATQYVKGSGEDTIYAREGNGWLRGIPKAEWDVAAAAGERFTEVPQELIDKARKVDA